MNELDEEARRRDAERYRFLRDPPLGAGIGVATVLRCWFGESLDRLIDELMRVHKKDHEL